MAGKEKKKKKGSSGVSGSGSIVSNYINRRNGQYERDTGGIASGSGSLVSNYINQREEQYGREIREREQQKRMASKLLTVAEKAGDGMRQEMAERSAREKKKQKKMVPKLLAAAEKAGDGMRQEMAERSAREKETRKKERKNPKNWFTTSDGNMKYKNPSLMGYDELQKAIDHAKKNKDQFYKKLGDSGLFKQGHAGEWDKVAPKDFSEKLGSKGVSWEDYKEYRSLWMGYQNNLEYMRELEKQKPRVQLEHEYDSLSDEDKKVVSEAVSFDMELEKKNAGSFSDKGTDRTPEAYRLSAVYEKYPRLNELKSSGVDVDYIIDSERIKRSNERQQERNQATEEFADKHPVIGSAASVASNLLTPLEIVEDLDHAIKNIASDKSYPIDYGQHRMSQYTGTTRQKVSEGIDNDAGRFIYNAGMSTIDSVADLAVAKGIGGGTKVASALMGANAANQAYMDTYERTGSSGQSLVTGLCAGMAEWASEKFSLDSFHALQTSTPKSFKEYAKNLVKQGVVEGSEEFVSDIANAFADRAINGSKSEYNTSVKEYIQQGYSKEEAKKLATKDFWHQVGEDTLAGSFSGGLFGTYANVYSAMQYKNTVEKNGTEIAQTGEAEDLVYYAEKNGINTYEDEKEEIERHGRIAFDIMENAANRIDRVRNSEELATVYSEVSKDIPDSLGADVDRMVHIKAQSLAGDSRMVSERQELYGVMENSLHNAMERTAAVNKKKQDAEILNPMEDKEQMEPLGRNTEPSSEEDMEKNPQEENPEYGEEFQRNYMDEEEISEAQSVAEDEKVTSADFKHSQNAAFTASDEAVEVRGFREIGTEDATVETSDGEVVSLSDLSFPDPGTQNMFNIASKMENAAAATVLVDHYNGRGNAGVYANNFSMAYRMGRLGSVSFDKMMQSSKEFRIMSDTGSMRLAYELGKAHAENEQAAKTKQSVAPAHEKRKGKGEYTDYRYGGEDQDGFSEVKKALAKKTGLDILDLDTLTEDDAYMVNGFLNINKGEMAFADDAENKFGVMIHESLEFASVISEGNYQKLMGVVLNYMVDEHGVEDVHSLIASYQKAYEAAEGEKAFEDAAGEMLNDAVSGVFYDAEGARSFIDWVMKDESFNTKEKKNVFQKMADLVKHIFDKIKEYIDDTPMTKAARMAAELKVEQKEEIRQLFMDAVDQAGERYKSETNVKGGNAEAKDKVSKRDAEQVKYSINIPLKDSEGRELSKGQQDFFKDSKIVDESGNLKVMYHGTGRADRVGYYFDPAKATSGPMAYFTDSNKIADRYSKDKADTSIAYDEQYADYYTQFRVTRDGENMSIGEVWNRLSFSEKEDIEQKAGHIKFDDDYENIIYDEEATMGNGNFDSYLLQKHGGNVLEALVDAWIESGDLYGEEVRLKDVLKLVGISDVDYMDPDYREEKVYEVYLNVTNPFDATDISDEMMAKIEDASENAEETIGKSADAWDKRNISPEAFIERVKEDQKNGTTRAWVSIPDFVTDVLKENGYDGILDKGGKNGGAEHQVVIPFYSEQIKQTTNENPTKENKDIRYSIKVDLEKQIDHVLDDTVPENYTHVYLGETTQALKEIGWTELPMLMTNQHVYSVINSELAEEKGRYKKIRNYHGLGKKKFMQVLKDIEKPVMMIKSNLDRNNADLILVSSILDQKGNTVIAALKPNGVGRREVTTVDANIVLSMYGKETIKNFIEKADREDRIIKVNPDKAVGPTVQFRGNLLHQDYSNNLAQYKEIVNNIISDKGKKHSIRVSERVDELRHSLSDTMDTEKSLVEENEYLRQVIKNLESEFKPGVKTVPDPARVESVCKKLLKKYHSSFDLETFKENVTKLYEYMNEDNADYEAALKITSEIARGVLEKSMKKDTTMYDAYKDLREYFRKTELSLSEAQKSEVKYMYGSMGEFRKGNFGRLRIANEGTSLDQVWGELSESYPELFKADTVDGDMITEVVSVLDGLRPTYQNVYGEDIEQASYDLALQIYSEINRVPQKQTFKDKADAAVENEWKESNRVYLNLLDDFRKECRRQFEEGLQVSMEEYTDDKKKRIRQAYGKIRDYANVIEVTQNGDLIRKYQQEIDKQKRYIDRLKKGQDRKLAEMKMENRRYRENLSEQRKQTEEKNKIRRLHARLRQMLMKPKEGMYVPQDLVRSVIDVCEAVNLGAKEGTKLYASLDVAKKMFDSMKKDDDYNYASAYDEEISSEIEYIKEKFQTAEKTGDKSIYNLSSKDLHEIYNAMDEVYRTIRRATELIRKEGEKDARKAATKVMGEVRSAKGLSAWMKRHRLGRFAEAYKMNSLNAYRAFRRIVGYKDGEFMREWEELNEGQRKMLKIQQDGEAIIDEVMQDKKVIELMKSFDKKDGLVDSGLVYKNGKKVFITKGMRMALVMHGMNEDNMRHMIHGGVVIPDVDLYVKGDRKGAYGNVQTVKGITSAKIQMMEDAMSPEEKKVLAAFKELFHEYTGKVINNTSLELYGYKKANEKNYYPIHVDEAFIATEISSVKMDKTLEGAGYLKRRVRSTKPLVMESIVDTAQRSLTSVSQFGGLAIPLRNFQKVYNGVSYKVTDADGPEGADVDSVLVADDSVKKALSDVWGGSAEKYINNLISDLQGARKQETDLFDRLRGNFAGAVLTGNASVIMKQAASYPTAAATVGWKPLMKALAMGGKNNFALSSADRELIAKYTPLLWYRNKGNSTKELADLAEMNSFTNRTPVVREIKNMIQKVDVATVGRLWYAAQYYVNDNYKELKKGTDAYYRKVAEIYNRCVEDTQPNYTVMQRPEFLRSPNKAAKFFLMFMTQRMQNYGIVYDAACNLHAKMKNGTKLEKRQARGEFARALSSQIVSAAVLSTMTFLARGLLHKVNPYRDDENELTVASIMEEWINGMMGSLAGGAIGGNELYNLIYSAVTQEKYYGIEVSLVSELNGLSEALVNMVNGAAALDSDSADEVESGRKKIRNGFMDALGGVAKMLGVPYDNVKNVGEGIWKNAEDEVSGEGLFSFSSDQEEPKSSVYAKKIYRALMDGDKEAAKEYRSKMKKSGEKGEGDVETAMINQLVKRNDLVRQAAECRMKNNTDGYMKIYKQLKGIGFNHYEVVGSINSVLEKLKGDGSSGPKEAHDYIAIYKTGDLVRAIEAEKGYEDILDQMYKEKIEAGKDDKKARAAIRASITKVYKEKYKGCKTAHEKQEILRKLYKLKINRQCLYDSGIFQQWNKED